MNLDRRIKRHLLAPVHRALIQPGPGCRSAVEEELRALLDNLITPGSAPASLKSTPDGVLVAPIRYRPLLELALRLTTAQDILLLLGSGPVHNREDLAALLEPIDWQFFLRDGDRVYLRCDSRSSTLYHEGIIREVLGARLERLHISIVKGGDAGQSSIVVVRIEHNRCSVLVSLAGAPLWKRGYRGSAYAPAPLREDLAQSAIRMALEHARNRGHGSSAPESPGWVADVLFLPFSGSGTVLLEYLILRFLIPPFLFRGTYAFEQFPAPLPPSVGWVKARLLDSFTDGLSTAAPFFAGLVERDGQAVAAAEENLRRFESLVTAGRSRPLRLPIRVESTVADVFARPWRTWLPREARRVFLPMNPPYGLRLSTRSTVGLYGRIGSATAALAAALPPGGLCGFVLCPSEQSWQSFLGAAQRLDVSTTHFSQGGLDIRLCVFGS